MTDPKNYKLSIEDPRPDSFLPLISVSVWTLVGDGCYRSNDYFVEDVFPTLMNFHLCDASEGFMDYIGPLDKYELAEVLRQIGFQVEIMI